MKLQKREKEMEIWLDSVKAAVVKTNDAKLVEQILYIQEQVELYLLYQKTLATISNFSRSIKTANDSLVPFSLPLRPTAKTLENMEEGVFRSFNRFVDDLFLCVSSLSTTKMEHAGNDIDSILMERISGVLAIETIRIFKGEVKASQGCALCIKFLENERAGLVRNECVRLREAKVACGVVGDLMVLFSKRLRTLKKSAGTEAQVATGRAWLRSAARLGYGLSHAVHILSRRQQSAHVFDRHPWLTRQYARFSDAEVLDVWQQLTDGHVELGQIANWETRRIDWLTSTNVANQAWCGVCVAPSDPAADASADPAAPAAEPADLSEDCNRWAVGGALVHAPAHMKAFATTERVRVVSEVQLAPFACFLPAVRLVNVIMELLHSKKLVLNKLSSSYLDRIALADYAKYEVASDRILAEELVPFGLSAGCPCSV